jgi:hypothetical protein
VAAPSCELPFKKCINQHHFQKKKLNSARKNGKMGSNVNPGIFFDLPQNRGADSQQNVFYCIPANFYPFLTLIPYFFQEVFEFFKNEKIFKF